MSDHNQHAAPRPGAMPDKPRYRWLMMVVGGLFVANFVGVLAMWLFFQGQSQEVVAVQVLQKDHPPLQELRARELERLTTYGVVDEARGLYRVPVDRGIDLYLETVRAKAAAGEAMRIGPPVPAVGAAGTAAVPAGAGEAAGAAPRGDPDGGGVKGE